MMCPENIGSLVCKNLCTVHTMIDPLLASTLFGRSETSDKQAQINTNLTF